MNQIAHEYHTNIQNLKQILEEQHTRLTKMLLILCQEHSALVENNIETFEQVVQQKHQQVKSLEDIQPRLSELEKILGGVLSKTTFTAFIQRMPKSAEKDHLESVWGSFQKTLHECNQQNKINNRILSASSINVKQALNILRGNTDQESPAVYGSTGLQNTNAHGQSLAIA